MSQNFSKPKRIDVSIGGVSYHLFANENEEYMRDIAAKADDAIRDIMIRNPSLSGMQSAILLIINLMDNLTKIKSEYDALISESEKGSTELEACSKELFVQRDVNFEIKKELLRVNELNKQLMLELASLKSDNTLQEEVHETGPEPEVDPEPDPEPEPEPELDYVYSNEPEEFRDLDQTTLEEYLSNSI